MKKFLSVLRSEWPFAVVMLTGAILYGAVTSAAQDAPKPPALTEVQKLTIQNLAMRMDNAQLKAQLAQAEFDKARTEIATLVQSLQVSGFTLDLNTLTYTKTPEPIKKE